MSDPLSRVISEEINLTWRRHRRRPPGPGHCRELGLAGRACAIMHTHLMHRPPGLAPRRASRVLPLVLVEPISSNLILYPKQNTSSVQLKDRLLYSGLPSALSPAVSGLISDINLPAVIKR